MFGYLIWVERKRARARAYSADEKELLGSRPLGFSFAVHWSGKWKRVSGKTAENAQLYFLFIFLIDSDVFLTLPQFVAQFSQVEFW